MTDRFRVIPAAYVLLVRGLSVLLQLPAGIGGQMMKEVSCWRP